MFVTRKSGGTQVLRDWVVDTRARYLFFEICCAHRRETSGPLTECRSGNCFSFVCFWFQNGSRRRQLDVDFSIFDDAERFPISGQQIACCRSRPPRPPIYCATKRGAPLWLVHKIRFGEKQVVMTNLHSGAVINSNFIRNRVPSISCLIDGKRKKDGNRCRSRTLSHRQRR